MWNISNCVIEKTEEQERVSEKMNKYTYILIDEDETVSNNKIVQSWLEKIMGYHEFFVFLFLQNIIIKKPRFILKKKKETETEMCNVKDFFFICFNFIIYLKF